MCMAAHLANIHAPRIHPLSIETEIGQSYNTHKLILKTHPSLCQELSGTELHDRALSY